MFNILIVDSHPVYILKLESFLQKFSFREILLASGGQEGLKKAILHRPPVVIVSAVLSDMTGEEFCWQVKELAKVRTKIIVLAGLFVDENDMRKMKNRGADEILMKKEKDLKPLEETIQRFLPQLFPPN
jgi:DNA-binding NarL/FixJ family response regulator